MTELNNQLGAIDLNLPFAEQETIQNFLSPVLSQPTEVVSNEVLFRFLLIAEAAISPNIDEDKRLNGLKLGYERQVLLQADGENYRVESQFVADQNWRTDFEPFVREQVQFLTDLPAEPEEMNEADANSLLKTLLMNLSEQISEELYRIYPTLKDCLEIHTYLSINLSPEGFRFREDAPEILAAYSCPGCMENNVRQANKKRGSDGVCVSC